MSHRDLGVPPPLPQHGRRGTFRQGCSGLVYSEVFSCTGAASEGRRRADRGLALPRGRSRSYRNAAPVAEPYSATRRKTGMTSRAPGLQARSPSPLSPGHPSAAPQGTEHKTRSVRFSVVGRRLSGRRDRKKPHGTCKRRTRRCQAQSGFSTLRNALNPKRPRPSSTPLAAGPSAHASAAAPDPQEGPAGPPSGKARTRGHRPWAARGPHGFAWQGWVWWGMAGSAEPSGRARAARAAARALLAHHEKGQGVSP